jgi:hypothetical protein
VRIFGGPGGTSSFLPRSRKRSATGQALITQTVPNCLRPFGFKHNLLSKQKTDQKVGILFGGPAYTFLKPSVLPNNLIEDLILLYTRLVDLGVEYRDGKVYLAELEEKDV